MPESDLLVPVTVALDPDMVDQLDRAADQQQRTRSNLIRLWLGERLTEEKKQAKEKR